MNDVKEATDRGKIMKARVWKEVRKRGIDAKARERGRKRGEDE